MPDFIVNPRRSPRAPVRCEARVALSGGGFWTGPTTDYGPSGCQLATPAPLLPGQRVFLELANDAVGGPFALTGRVAWSTHEAPWRAGIAFDEGSAATAADFFTRLAAAHPGVDAVQAPDRIPEDAVLAPTPPPGSLQALAPEEMAVLVAVGPGLSAAALRARLGDRWSTCVNPLFALLGRRYLVVGPPDAAAAVAWAPHLARAAAGRQG